MTAPKTFSPFLVLPTSSVVGDYQILFDLNSNMSIKVYMPPSFMKDAYSHKKKNRKSESMRKKSDEVLGEQTHFMCINADKFLHLCNLYPQTANDLKMRGLERRQFFMEKLHDSEKIRRFKSMPGLAKAFSNKCKDEG